MRTIYRDGLFGHIIGSRLLWHIVVCVIAPFLFNMPAFPLSIALIHNGRLHILLPSIIRMVLLSSPPSYSTCPVIKKAQRAREGIRRRTRIRGQSPVHLILLSRFRSRAFLHLYLTRALGRTVPIPHLGRSSPHDSTAINRNQHSTLINTQPYQLFEQHLYAEHILFNTTLFLHYCVYSSCLAERTSRVLNLPFLLFCSYPPALTFTSLC